MPYDSVKIKLKNIVFNDSDVEKNIDPKLKALAKLLIKKGIITKQELLTELRG